MFIALQFPLTDARPFFHANSHRLLCPTWPLPKPDTDFVRAFGPVQRRLRGGLKEWPGEEMYCRAARAIQFQQPVTKVTGMGSAGTSIKQYCAFRRFFSDGCAMARMEIGLGYRKAVQNVALNDKDFLALLSSLFNQKVSVKSVQRPLIAAGPILAESYLQASTQKNSTETVKTESWWVSAGEPLLLVEYQLDELKSPPKYSQHIQSPALMYALVSLSHLWINLNGKQFGVWLLGYSPSDTDRDVLRRLRLNLFRLHAEQESLKQILRLIAQGKIEIQRDTPATERLQRYLQSTVSFLSKESREGLPQSAIRDVVEQAEGIISEGERETLLNQLSDIRRNLLHNIEELTRPEPKIYQPIYNIINTGNTGESTILIQQETTMNNQNMNISNSTVGDINQVAADSIQNSFNKVSQSNASQELKDQIAELTKAVTEMCKSLPEGKQQQAAQDLKTLTDEATSEEPRREWYELSAKGLMEAAKSVGELATPVITTAKAVLALLAA